VFQSVGIKLSIGGGVAQLVECQVAKLWFDSRCNNASLCSRKRPLMQFLILEPSSLPFKQNNCCVGVVRQT